MSSVLYIDNSNTIELGSLTEAVTDTVDTTASVQLTVVDADDTPVAGQPWPATMDHDADGTYRATLNPGLALVENALYYAKVTVTGTGGATANFTMRLRAKERGRC